MSCSNSGTVTTSILSEQSFTLPIFDTFFVYLINNVKHPSDIDAYKM